MHKKLVTGKQVALKWKSGLCLVEWGGLDKDLTSMSDQWIKNLSPFNHIHVFLEISIWQELHTIDTLTLSGTVTF